MGDLNITDIDRKVMSSFKDTLMKLPPNLNKSPKYRDKSIEQIIASKPTKTLAPLSINKILTRMGSLFIYAVHNGYMQVNPADGLKMKIKKEC
jgi:site-specific recombinase XerD